MKKLKLMTIVGTRPEIIKMSAIMKKCDEYFDHIIVHTGQNYDYTLNQVFFEELDLREPDYYLGVVGENLGQTMGNVLAKSYELMVKVKPDALIVLGDTNSCLCVISAKRLKIPVFHMEAGNRCFDENLPEEVNRRIVDVTSDVNYLNGVSTAIDYLLGRNPLEQSYVTGYGEHATTYPHHRWWSYQLDKSFPMAPKGVLSGGPNSNMEDPMVLGAGYKRGEIAPMKCYLDNLEAWSVNECTINWNSPLVWVVSFLEDEAPKAGSHSQTTTKVTTTTASGETTTTTAKTTTTASGSTTTGKVGDALIGDTNLDGAVSLADLITFQKQQRGAIDFNDQQMINADCDQTDAEGITSSDVSVLLQFLIGKINALPLQ